MLLIAIDPATKCGWATSAGDYGVWDLSTRRDESAGMKWLRLRGKLEELRKSYIDPTTAIVYERPGGRYTGAVIHHAKLVGVIEEFSEYHGIAYRGYSASEIKQIATGKGNSPKAAVIQAAQERLGYTGADDNEADALWLLELIKRDIQF